MPSTGALLGICLTLAAGSQPDEPAAAPVFVPAQRFTLAWTHSIEKVRWEEDYAVLAATAQHPQPRLQALEARIHGSGAGMEPPEDARLINGQYHYQPPTWPAVPLRLTRSEFTPDYTLCLPHLVLAGGAAQSSQLSQPLQCQPLGQWLASDGGVTWLMPCTLERVHSPLAGVQALIGAQSGIEAKSSIRTNPEIK